MLSTSKKSRSISSKPTNSYGSVAQTDALVDDGAVGVAGRPASPSPPMVGATAITVRPALEDDDREPSTTTNSGKYMPAPYALPAKSETETPGHAHYGNGKTTTTTLDAAQTSSSAALSDRLLGSSSSDAMGSSSSDKLGLSDDDVDAIICKVKKYQWTPPPDADQVPYKPHQGEGSQYLRDFILGVNDGLVSTFLVVVGVVAGGSSATTALLTAISSAIAGALSMGIGEFVATKSQTEVSDGEMAIEREHFMYHRDVELQQLRDFLAGVKLSGPLLEAVVAEVGRDDEALMKMMMAFEFGVQEDLERNPWKAMFMSGRLFAIGSLPSVIPFFFMPTVMGGLAVASALVGASLLLVGAYKTRTTNGNPLHGALENFLLGAVATGISYGVGVAFDEVNKAV